MNTQVQRTPFMLSDYKGILRSLYYKLPVGHRFLIRRILYLPYDWATYWKRKQQNCPPKGMVFVGGGDFIQTGARLASRLVEHCNLNETAAVLDIGCGIGRIAVPLTSRIGAGGRYDGFDVVETGIDWCQKHISVKYPQFNFLHVRIANDLYNAEGQQAGSFTFPYPNNTYDIACSFSVFTHMLPDGVSRYLQESYRVLKPGGRLYATFFINNEYAAFPKEFNFPYAFKRYALMDTKITSANVLYDRAYLLDMIEASGFRLHNEVVGRWNNVHGSDLQDALILVKPS